MGMHVRRNLICWIGAALAALPTLAQEPCYYSWQRIRISLDQLCAARDVNNHGAVCGIVYSGGDNTRAFVWTAETGVRVLPLPTSPPGILSMEAHAINDSGLVVGVMQSFSVWYGFVWDGQEYTTINAPSWMRQIYVMDVNSRGEVAGTLFDARDRVAPFIWRDGITYLLAGPPGTIETQGNCINEFSAVGGTAFTDGRFHGFVVLDLRWAFWLETPAGMLQATASAMNNNGTTVGAAGNGQHDSAGAVWTQFEATLVTPPPHSPPSSTGAMTDINDAARGVGYFGSGSFGMVWQQGTARTISLMTEPPLSLVGGTAINTRGQIVAGVPSGSVLLTPHWRTGDLTGDCHVTLTDLALVLIDFGSPIGSFPRGDVDGDGQVTVTDLSAVLAHFGE
jgi:hypothetical protein